MKLRVNYDLINEILNIKEPLSLLKIVRNEKRENLMIRIPFFTAWDTYFFKDSILKIMVAFHINMLVPYL